MRGAALLLLVLGASVAQEKLPGGVHVADERYPCQRTEKVVRFFHLETDAPDRGEIDPALAELGAELAYGPRTTTGRPGHFFAAVRAPRAADEKKLAAALKKGGGSVEPLACTAFDGRTGKDHDFGLAGMGVSKRDFVMGGDVVWYDAFGPWSQLYGPPGKLKSAEVAKRYAKLYEPYGGAKLGEVVKERFTWTLSSAPDDKLRAKVLKNLEKTRGVLGASIDGTTLTVTVALDGLPVCADVGKLPSTEGEPLDEGDRDAPRAAFDAGAVFEMLLAEGLVK